MGSGKWEVGNQKSEVGSQKSEVGRPSSAFVTNKKVNSLQGNLVAVIDYLIFV